MSRLSRIVIAVVMISATASVAVAAKRRTGGVSAGAEESPLVGLHELRREAGKICMSEHEHSGSSSGQPTKKAAEVAAMQSWASFTQFEYGNSWGSPSLAAGKKMSCSGTPGSFSCDFVARPCRR